MNFHPLPGFRYVAWKILIRLIKLKIFFHLFSGCLLFSMRFSYDDKGNASMLCVHFYHVNWLCLWSQWRFLSKDSIWYYNSRDSLCYHLLSWLIYKLNEIFMSQLFSQNFLMSMKMRSSRYFSSAHRISTQQILKFKKLIELTLTSPTSCLPSHIFSSSSSKSSISLKLYIYNLTILSYLKF